MPGGSRSLPGRPNLRYLKLEAKRRVAAGEFPTLHEAQVAIAREHGLPGWTALKQLVDAERAGDGHSHALDQLRWVISRFAGADAPGWTAPADDELKQHFSDQFLTELPPPALIVLKPLGLQDSSFPARAAEINAPGSNMVTGYQLTLEGRFEPVPARIPTLQAAAGLWSTGADLVRLGLGWSSLLPEALAHEALTSQTDPGPDGARVGLGWIIAPRGDVAFHAGASFDATAAVTTRVRDQRTHVVLTSRLIPIHTIEARLLRAWTNPA